MGLKKIISYVLINMEVEYLTWTACSILAVYEKR